MATPRYKKTLDEIWKKNEQLFQQFFMLNQDYDDISKRKAIESDFQKIGNEVKNELIEGEKELCGKMEKGSNGKFSMQLADKYWNEVRKYFKYVDRVGVEVEYA